MIGTELKVEKQHYDYPHIRRVGETETEGLFDDKVIVQEKVDGAQFQFQVFEGKVIFGSRGQKIDHNAGGWQNQIKFIMQNYAEKGEFFSPQLVYFAEAMIKHTLVYEYNKHAPLIGFDIMDKQTELFLKPGVARQEFEKIGVPYVNTIFEKEGRHVKLDELIELVNKTLKSAYGPEAEGIVVKNYARLNKYGRPLFGKMVKDSFKERNKLAFSGLKELRDTERQIVEEFCTPARVEKLIRKLTVDEGNDLSMKLMPVLFKRVSDDILSEEILEIQKKYSEIQFKEFTGMVAAKCAKQLKEYLVKK